MPRKPDYPSDGPKTAAVAVRTTPRIKAMLEDAARVNRRSVIKEIESRLELSFAGDVLNHWSAPMAFCKSAHLSD